MNFLTGFLCHFLPRCGTRAWRWTRVNFTCPSTKENKVWSLPIPTYIKNMSCDYSFDDHVTNIASWTIHCPSLSDQHVARGNQFSYEMQNSQTILTIIYSLTISTFKTKSLASCLTTITTTSSCLLAGPSSKSKCQWIIECCEK